MSKYADTKAGHAYAKLDALDLNHINSRSTQIDIDSETLQGMANLCRFMIAWA